MTISPTPDEVIVAGRRVKFSQMRAMLESIVTAAEAGSAVASRVDSVETVQTDHASRLTAVEAATISGLTVYADTTAGLADTSEDDFFLIPGGEDESAFDIYLHDTGDVAVYQRSFASLDALRATEGLAPIPVNPVEYDSPRTMANKLLVSPTANLTPSSDSTSYTLAATNGVLGINSSTSAIITLTEGENIAIWFEVLSGAPATATVKFRTDADATISTETMRTVGRFRVFEGAIPATTEHFLLDVTNTAGTPLVIYRPRYAFGNPSPDAPSAEAEAVRLARSGIAAGAQNLWLDSFTVGKQTGDGDTTTDQGDGTFLVPADTVSYASSPNIFTVGTKLAWLAHANSGNLQNVVVRHQGGSGSETVPLQLLPDLGPGWFGGVSEVTATVGTATTLVRLEPDNRDSSYHTAVDVTFDQIILTAGEALPARIAAADYRKSEIVVTQDSGEINVFIPSTKPGSKRYFRLQINEFDDVSKNGSGWTWQHLHEMERTGDTSFVFANTAQLLSGGENWLAIKEAGKSDHMGGAAHGDHKIVGSARTLIDGAKVSIDGSTAYRAQGFEFLMNSQLFEADDDGTNLSADVSTSFGIEGNEAVLRQHLTFRRDMNLFASYLAMLSALRHQSNDDSLAQFTSEAYFAPDYDEIDVSATGHATPNSTAGRIMLAGPAGYAFEMEVLEGWTDANRASFVEDSTYNKIYCSALGIFGSGGAAVTNGQELAMKTRYKLLLSN